MSGKFALIIGNTEYTDPGLAQLTAPGRDAEDFARVLKDAEIGAFDIVNVLVNEQAASVIEAIDEFFDQKKPDDLLVLYFSGHGIRDEIGSLYLAFKNTIRSRLRSTAVKSDYIKEAMDQSRSKRQVLVLDCCNSGAFPQGTKAELGGSMGMTKAFQGYGRFVLTASDATQFAWEGDKVIGETDNSLFTHFLVKGLEGEADSDGDGRITVDELYDYTYDQISRVTPKQTPTKSSSKVEGEIVLRQSTRIENIKPVPLPAELMDEIEDTRPYVREAAVQKLEKLLKGKNIGLARSAKSALGKMIDDENTTPRVAKLAMQVLTSTQQVEQVALQKEAEQTHAEEDAKRTALQKVEAQRLVDARATETERLEKEKAEWLAVQRAEEDRIAKAKIDAERLAAKNAEAERIAKQRIEEERIAKAKIEAERLAKEKRHAREKADAEQKAKVLSAPEIAEKVLVTPRNIPSPQTKTKRQQPILKWILIGVIGLCVLGTGTWGISRFIRQQTLPYQPILTFTSIPAGSPTATETPSLGIGSTMIGADGATLVYVPAGEFTMGSDYGSSNELPIHTVYLEAFWINQTEVTNEMYAKCVDAGVCDPPSNIDHFSNSNYANHPVVFVDWYKANIYCSWAEHRLPTEAEWEKAASWVEEDQTKKLYPWGNSANYDCSLGNFYDIINKSYCIGDTTPVKNYESGKTPYGTYDTAGNVWEWVSSLFKPYPYDANDDRENMSASGERVRRGGSWEDSSYYDTRSIIRYWSDPTNSYSHVGFRCSRSTATQATDNSVLKATVAANATAYSDQATSAAYSTAAQATEDAKSFFEEFNDNSRNWILDDVDDEYMIGSRKISNGVFVWDITKVKQGFIYRTAYPNSPSVENFEVSVDAKSISDIAGNFCYGIYFRYSEGAYYDIKICNDQRYEIRYYDGNDWEELKEWATDTAIRQNDWNKIRVVANGSTFYVYINNVLVSQISDVRLPKGRAGFAIFADADEQGQIWFDNFLITIE